MGDKKKGTAPIKCKIKNEKLKNTITVALPRTSLCFGVRGNCFPNHFLDGFVEEGYGYVSFVVLRRNTQPTDETDTWPKPTPINEKPIQATAPGYPETTDG
jgi:hypothetical protein